jgi:hypothetical protein
VELPEHHKSDSTAFDAQIQSCASNAVSQSLNAFIFMLYIAVKHSIKNSVSWLMVAAK